MKRLMMIALVLFTSAAHAESKPGDVYQASIPRGENRIAPPEGFLALSALLAIPTVVYYDAAQRRRISYEIAEAEGRYKDAANGRGKYRKTMFRAGICAIATVGFFTTGAIKLAIEDDRATFRYEKRF